MHFGYSGAKPVCPLNQASCLHNSFAPLPRRQFNLTDAMMMTARETEMERRGRRGRGRSTATPTPTPTLTPPSTPQLSVPRTLEVPRARDTLRTFFHCEFGAGAKFCFAKMWVAGRSEGPNKTQMSTPMEARVLAE